MRLSLIRKYKILFDVLVKKKDVWRHYRAPTCGQVTGVTGLPDGRRVACQMKSSQLLTNFFHTGDLSARRTRLDGRKHPQTCRTAGRRVTSRPFIHFPLVAEQCHRVSHHAKLTVVTHCRLLNPSTRGGAEPPLVMLQLCFICCGTVLLLWVTITAADALSVK